MKYCGRPGIPVKVENWGGKMHMKAASVDGASLVLGSHELDICGDVRQRRKHTPGAKQEARPAV